MLSDPIDLLYLKAFERKIKAKLYALFLVCYHSDKSGCTTRNVSDVVICLAPFGFLLYCY